MRALRKRGAATEDNAVLGYIPNYVLDDEGDQVLNGAAFSNGSQYHVWIRSKNTTGESPDYAHIDGTPTPASGVPATPPGAPGLSPKDGALVVSLNAVKGATGYKLFYKSGVYNDTSDISGAASVTVNAGAGRMTGTIQVLPTKRPTLLSTGKEIAEAVCEWIYDQYQAGQDITPYTDGRITLKNEVWQ